MPKTPDVAPLLAVLRRHRVRFVLVGGVAAVVEGAPVVTFDVDVVPDRSAANIGRLVAALTEVKARYRTRPELNRAPSATDLSGPGHHLLTTAFGPLDVLGVIGRERSYDDLMPTARRRKLGDSFVWVLDLETQIAIKKELGFAKDRAALPVLEATLRQRRRRRRS